jgi:hypothetical protein
VRHAHVRSAQNNKKLPLHLPNPMLVAKKTLLRRTRPDVYSPASTEPAVFFPFTFLASPDSCGKNPLRRTRPGCPPHIQRARRLFFQTATATAHEKARWKVYRSEAGIHSDGAIGSIVALRGRQTAPVGQPGRNPRLTPPHSTLRRRSTMTPRKPLLEKT